MVLISHSLWLPILTLEKLWGSGLLNEVTCSWIILFLQPEDHSIASFLPCKARPIIILINSYAWILVTSFIWSQKTCRLFGDWQIGHPLVLQRMSWQQVSLPKPLGTGSFRFSQIRGTRLVPSNTHRNFLNLLLVSWPTHAKNELDSVMKSSAHRTGNAWNTKLGPSSHAVCWDGSLYW